MVRFRTLPEDKSDMQKLALDEAMRLAFEAYQQGDLEKAENIYRQIVATQPDNADALHLLGVVTHQRGDYRRAINLIDRAIGLNGKNYLFFNNMGISQLALDLSEAATISFRAALDLNPKSWQACYGLGRALMAQGRPDDAIESFERAVGLNPDHADAHDNLGMALFRTGAYDDAIFVFRAAIDLHPAVPALHNNLGLVLHENGDLEGAIGSFRNAIKLAPDLHQAHHNLALSLQALGMTDEAIACFREAIQRHPHFPEIYNSLGILFQNQYRLAEAVECYEQALSLRPDYAEAHSNLIIAKDFFVPISADQHLEERLRWNELQVGGRHITPAIPRMVVSDPERKLRVGYVSADFRRHSAACGFGLMLLNYDRTQFEVFCYSNSRREDDVTEKFRKSVNGWQSIYGMPDENAAEAVRADAIDILVDLSGHSYGNRLLMFARKPAPVQITAWGYATGTGLEAMDYLLSDEVIVPPGEQKCYRERIAYLPCLISYLPLGEAIPSGPLPALHKGHVTFGYFNNYAKLSDDALATWSRLLSEMGNAELLFKGRSFGQPERQKRVLSALAAAGGDVAKVQFAGGSSWRDHMAAHTNVDIALDPFPYSGGISTAEALWMGVPVIALCGNSASQRTAASILKAAGLGDWVASTPQQYCQLAAQKARNFAELATLRAKLREHFPGFAIMNPAIYVSAVERVYRNIWREWCATRNGEERNALGS